MALSLPHKGGGWVFPAAAPRVHSTAAPTLLTPPHRPRRRDSSCRHACHPPSSCLLTGSTASPHCAHTQGFGTKPTLCAAAFWKPYGVRLEWPRCSTCGGVRGGGWGLELQNWAELLHPPILSHPGTFSVFGVELVDCCLNQPHVYAALGRPAFRCPNPSPPACSCVVACRYEEYDAQKLVDCYLNLPEVQAALGVDPEGQQFVSCSDAVAEALGPDGACLARLQLNCCYNPLHLTSTGSQQGSHGTVTVERRRALQARDRTGRTGASCWRVLLLTLTSCQSSSEAPTDAVSYL